METLDAFLRAQIDPLQYAAFFGSLIILFSLEMVVERSSEPPVRGRRWPLNFGLTALNIVILGAIPVSGVAIADYAREIGFGLFNMIGVAPIAALIVGILFRSFLSWFIHFAMHKVPLLWRLHRVHHTDTFVDVSTTVRFHPGEYLVSTPIIAGGVFLMGISPIALMIYEVFDAAMAVFTHANIRMPKPVDRFLRLLLVTPDMHRVHHSSHQPETDSNYGATLSIWDRLFRTYTEKEPEELATMQLGLKECQDERSTSFWWQLRLPLTPSKIEKTEMKHKLSTETKIL